MLFAGHILFALAALGYLAAFAVGLPALRRNGSGLSSLCAKLTVGFVAAAFACQTVGMVLRGIALHHCPLEGPADVLQIAAWSLVVMYGIVGAAFRMSLLGFFTALLAAVLSTAALFNQGAVFSIDAPAIVLVHAWLSLFSYGAFGLLALTAYMYLVQLHGIRKRRWTGIFALLPSLKELEVVNQRLLVVSTMVYTLAVVLGAVWYFSGEAAIGAAKLMLASILWIGYVAALGLRLKGHLRGPRIAVVGIALFVLALITLYPVEHQHGGAAVPAKVEAVR